jgi:hypothetical protein
MRLPADAGARKAIPLYSGFLKYFPNAIAAVAELSQIGNDQHHPDTSLHWDKNKSTDELDAALRHLLDLTVEGPDCRDDDGVLHATKFAWRALANLQRLADQGVDTLSQGDSESGYSKQEIQDFIQETHGIGCWSKRR